MKALAPALVATALVLGVCGLAIGGLASGATGYGVSLLDDPYILHALKFTLVQAMLSTLLSLALGAALALARRHFPLRGLAISALGAVFVLPSIVAVVSIVAVFGRSGFVNTVLQWFNTEQRVSIFGLQGILLAHVFFNAPLAARIFLNALEAVPPTHWWLARSLGFSPAQVFTRLDWPALRRSGPGAAGLIFILCATSFAIVLALGGGPQSATLEVAIYESLRFDFNLPRAASLAFLQSALILMAFLVLELGLSGTTQPEAHSDLLERSDRASIFTRLQDALAFVLALALLAGPIFATVIGTSPAKFLAVLQDPAFYRALWGSLAIAVPAGLLAICLASAIAYGVAHVQIALQRRTSARLLGASASLLLILPPFALAAGLFIALRGLADPARLAMPLVALVNALTGLPIALRIIGPPVLLNAERHGRLAASLGVHGLTRLRLVDAPLLRAPLGLALATVIAFSIGDLGVAALFGMGDVLTLPLYVYSLLGAYRVDQGGAAALLLCGVILLLFLTIERLAKGRKQHA